MHPLEYIRNIFQSMKSEETLDPSPWRRRARIASYIELGLSLIAMMFFAYSFIRAGIKLNDENAFHELAINNQTNEDNLTTFCNSTRDSEHDPTAIRHHVIRYYTFGAAFVGAVTCFDVWSALLLYKSTKVGAEPKLSRERARYWCYVQLVLVVLATIYTLYLRAYYFFAFKLIGRVVLMSVVFKFMVELTNNLNAAKPIAGSDLFVVTTTA